MVEVKVGKVSPFADTLIRGALYFGGLEFNEFSDSFVVKGDIGEVFRAVADLVKQRREEKFNILTPNDRRRSKDRRKTTWERVTGCLGLSTEVTPEKLFSTAGNSLEVITKCGRVEASLSVLKAEFYEYAREPLLKGSKYSNEADVLSVLLVLAGYYGWKLGRTKVSEDFVDVLLMPLVSVSEGKGAAEAFRKIVIKLEKLPKNLGHPLTFSLWLALNVPLDSSVQVFLISTGNRVSVKGNFTVDLVRLRKGIEELFSSTSPLEKLIGIATSDDVSAETDNFVRLVYNAINKTVSSEELMVRGLRYASSKPDKKEFNIFKEVAKAVKL
jgi:hypothetical protein